MDLLREIRHNPLFWLLALVPALFAVELLKPEAHTLLFVLSVLAIVTMVAGYVPARGASRIDPVKALRAE